MGTTPICTNIADVFRSLVSQIDLLFNINSDGEDLSKYDGKNMGNVLLSRFAKLENHDFLVLLDSIDQLNKSDYSLEWMIWSTPKNVKIIYSILDDEKEETLKHDDKPFEILKERIVDKNSFLKIPALDFTDAISIFETLLTKKEFSSSSSSSNQQAIKIIKNEQREAINSLFKNENTVLYPLYVKLIYDIISTWNSFTRIPESFPKLYTIDRCIEYLFKSLEDDYGKLLVSRCLFYLTSANETGISDVEMQEVLTLDDEVLENVFGMQLPSTLQFPITLWLRIKQRMRSYLTIKNVDDTQVNCWYHNRFYEVGRKVYVNGMDFKKRDELHQNLFDFFNEKWLHVSKCPNRFLRTLVKSSKSKHPGRKMHKRFTASQPLRYMADSLRTSNVNKRKVNKMLETAMKIENNIRRSEILVKDIFLNYAFLTATFECHTLNAKYFDLLDYCLTVDFMQELFDYFKEKINTKNSYFILLSALVQYILICNSNYLNKYYKAVGLELCSRLQTFYGISDSCVCSSWCWLTLKSQVFSVMYAFSCTTIR